VQLTAENTAIVLDSTADFPEAPKRFPNWRVVPLYVLFGDESYRDYVELAPAEFYARLRSADQLPTTSQPTPGDFLRTYEELAGYDRIYSLHLSAVLSGTYQSAATAATELGDKVRTVDSESASAAIAMLGLAVQRRLEAGTTDEEIDELVRRFRETARLIFTVDTLEFLRRGGRIGGAQAWIGSTLKIKPILAIESEIVPVERVRTWGRAFERMVDHLSALREDGNDRVFVQHIQAADQAEKLAQRGEAIYGRPPEFVSEMGPVIGAHAGPGLIGVTALRDALLGPV
jgi:DegV family protein with EDD domain